jgi:HSP20 family molecular chaperone IbpA
MTTRVFTSPLFLGFDHLEQILERASKTQSEGYPPYNIEQTGPSGLRISLAVAGFSMEDLQITHEDNQLVIRGRQGEDTQNRVFLYRGIASRQFQRAFVLAEGIEIKGAWLNNGLLHVDLMRPQPETRVRTIPIDTIDTAAKSTAAAVPARARRDIREVAEARTEIGPQVGIARIVGEQ